MIDDSPDIVLYIDPGDFNRLSLGVFSTNITATNSRACIEVAINDDDLLEETEVFTVQVVPEPSAHQFGLPENFLLIPNLTSVEIVDNERKHVCMQGCIKPLKVPLV